MAHLKQDGAKRLIPVSTLGLSTHFDAWKDWRTALTSVLSKQDIHLSGVVGVSAGRPEWAHFKWKGHENMWSSQQKRAKDDLFAEAVSTFHKSGFKVAAFVDIFGPEHIRKNPETAAVGFDGKVNAEQVAFMEIIDGRYGGYILDMVEYVAGNYEADIINLTEMPYYSYSYSDRDLKSYAAFSGRKDDLDPRRRAAVAAVQLDHRERSSPPRRRCARGR